MASRRSEFLPELTFLESKDLTTRRNAGSGPEYAVIWRIMSAQRTISFRIPVKKVKTLDALAETMDRDRSYLLNEAVEHYLELNEYHIKLIEKGLRAAEKGDFVADGEMKRLVGRMRRAK